MTPADETDEVLEAESQRVILEALTSAYQDIHRVLDDAKPTAERLSGTLSRLAVALRVMGSSGGEALDD